MKEEQIRPWLKQKAASVTLGIAVQPSAKKSEVVGLHGDYLKVKIAAPPRDGEANEEVIRFLAELFGVKKNSVSLLQGQTGRKKVVEILGVNADEVLKKIPLS